MGPQATSGQSLYEAMQAVAQAEGGVLFADGSGDITMQGRYFRGLRTTADLTLGETEPGPDTAVTWDTQQKINQVTVTRTGGATQVYPTLAAGTLVYPQSLDIAVDTDDSALSAAEWLVSKHTETAPRLGSVTFDLMTSASAEAILDLTLGERLDLSAMPSQLWAGLGDYTIEGWTESLSDTAWTLAVNLLPFDLAEVAVWDDAASLWDSAVWGY